MAAKQGLTAHISQASEDARRAVLSRAPNSVRSHSWLSNLNTTCTIKSAPPRTPEVMSMLSTKCGWLTKRNEQNVWQKRWCCIVPHTFLYYFDAEPIEQAAALGPIYEGDEHTYGGASPNGGTNGGAGKSYSGYSNAQPVGIIDLECYTTVERHDEQDFMLELTGDPITNPDLRSFYFKGESEECCEHWTKSFISDRHSALKDERDAYQQVCESFPMQLVNCAQMVDEAEGKQKDAEREAYKVRSLAEENRKRVIQAVREALERRDGEEGLDEWISHGAGEDGHHKSLNLIEIRKRYLSKLGKIASGVSMNSGVCESVDILAKYAEILRVERAQFGNDLKDMRGRVKDLGHSMISRKEMDQMQKKLDRSIQAHQIEKTRMAERITSLEKILQKERQEREDSEKTLEAKNMEFTMLSAASKQKIQELSYHKKILKKEVIELRKKVEDSQSDATAFKHKSDGLEMHVKAEKERNQVLERHLEHVSGQVKMQERMLDMMSQSGSVYGGSRNGDNNSVGGNSSAFGFPSAIRTTNSRAGGKELPRYPSASPRHVPPEITPRPPTSEKRSSSATSGDTRKTESGTRGSHHQNTSDQNGEKHRREEKALESNYDDDQSQDDEVDDEESLGNVSGLTEDRTFRSEPIENHISPTSNKEVEKLSTSVKNKLKLDEVMTPTQFNSRTDPNPSIPSTSKHETAARNESSNNTNNVPTSSSRQRHNSQQQQHQHPSEARDVARPPLRVETSHRSNKLNRGPSREYGQYRQNQTTDNNDDNISVSMSSIQSSSTFGDYSIGKMSVAQRARMEAESSPTKLFSIEDKVEPAEEQRVVNTVPTIPAKEDAVSPSGGSVSGGSLWERLGNKLVDTIDNSVLNPSQSMQNDADNSSYVGPSSSFGGESQQNISKPPPQKVVDVTASSPRAPPSRTLSLAERQKLQREKQMAFLRQQGLVREDQNVSSGDSVASMGSRRSFYSRS